MIDRAGSISPGHTFLLLLTAGCGLLILTVLGFMVFLGWPLFTVDFFNLFMSPVWAPDQYLFGILPFVCGTFAIVILSLLIAFPLSLGNAILINLFLSPMPAKFLYRMVKLMTGIPTVIYGFVGISLLVPFLREWSASGSGMSLFSAALLLALLISPTMILIFVESFAAIPQPHLNAVAALGGNARHKLIFALLPGAKNGIMTGLLLAAGRALGDTMIALMVAGNATAMPESMFDSIRTLTAHIALVMAADFDSIEFRTIFVCGIILYLASMILILTLRTFNRRGAKTDMERGTS